MKSIQNLGGFVLTSTPFRKAGKDINDSGNNPSSILKFDYCIPPDDDIVFKQRKKIASKGQELIMNKKSNAA